jgi:hypothetical protein
MGWPGLILPRRGSAGLVILLARLKLAASWEEVSFKNNQITNIYNKQDIEEQIIKSQ